VAFILIPASAFTLATLLLVVLWRIGLAVLHRQLAPRFWRRAFKWHGYLFLVHAFVSVPFALAMLFTSFIGTRGDERSYAGPRIAEDGSWTAQTRESLSAEKEGQLQVPARVQAAAATHAVSLVARDGVKLRAFLVPPANAPAEAPRFVAVLAHGLFRGALEIETPGRMLRDLGGEVLLLELRNHGGSERARATYGRDEALDVLAAVEFLRARPEAAGRPLLLFAVSFGTAAVSLAAPQIPELGGLVLDAPIDDLAATVRRVLASGGFWRSIRDPWAATILFFLHRVRGIPFDQVRPREALTHLPAKVPVLCIGAGRDDRMPPDSVRALFESLPTTPARKELWIVPEATHGKVWLQEPQEYARRLAALADKLQPRN
jgi:pimeloyl-ACP methyl ester carboxylesterase